MEVNRTKAWSARLIVASSLLALMGCTQTEYGSAIFPETKSECEETAFTNRFIVHWQDGRVSVVKSPNREAFMREFLEPNSPLIRKVEHDQYIEPITHASAYASATPTVADDWGQTMVQADKLWNRGVDGKGVLVAVVDTGLALNHPQLAPQVEINAGEVPNNGIDDDRNGWVDDYTGYNFQDDNGDVTDEVGHGTHVAGIIAANPDFGDVKGLAPRAKILPLKFLSSRGGSLGDALTSIKYAADYAKRSDRPLVINASWGGANCSNTFSEVIAELQQQKTLFVVAAGNRGINIDLYPEFPAALDAPMQITVGAVTSRSYLAGFSNYGAAHVHIVAPGEGIVSTFPGELTRTLSGTSMAAPFVSGAAALLWSRLNQASGLVIREALLKGVEKGPYSVQSMGLLNVEKAFLEISEL